MTAGHLQMTYGHLRGVDVPELETDLTTADPFAPEHREDPWPLYHLLQEQSPVHRFPSGGWFLTRYADCDEVLRDRRFGSDPAKLNDRAKQYIGDNEVYRPGSNVILFMDPPDHTRLRSLVS